MKRDIKKICSETLDVLVVGAGIHGAAIAYHTAKQGYRTAIVDKNDFCGATSANSLKILHGGLRYLQHGNIKRMRHSILSRQEMMRLAPYLVQPLPCMMPIYGNGMRGRLAMKTALFINDCVSWDRNQGLPEKLWLPKGSVVSEGKCREVIPDIEEKDLRGAAVWYDVLALDTERLVLEYILGSVRYGGEAANYIKVISVAEEEDDVYSVTLEDQLTNQVHHVKTRFIINASGPWFDESLFATSEHKAARKQKWALALNLVSKKKIFDNYAVALEGQDSYQDKDAIIKRDKRLFFFVPWRGYTMIGTEYEVSHAGPDDLKVDQEKLENMVQEINTIYPSAQLKYEDISFYHAGLLPMQSGSDYDGVQLEKNSTFVANRNDKLKGVLSLKSVKYTTAPHIAHEVVGYLQGKLPASCPNNTSEAFDESSERIVLAPKVRELLEQRYGQGGSRVTPYMEKGDSDHPWVDKACQMMKAEVKYLASDEMVCRLSDIVFRRTGLGTAECPPLDTLTDIAGYLGEILGWDQEKIDSEVQDVLDRYSPLKFGNS